MKQGDGGVVASAVGVDDALVDETAALAAAACLFRSLGDPSRLAILRHLAATGEHRVRELTEHLAWRSPRCPSTASAWPTAG